MSEKQNNDIAEEKSLEQSNSKMEVNAKVDQKEDDDNIIPNQVELDSNLQQEDVIETEAKSEGL